MGVGFYWCIRDTQSLKYHLNEIHYFHGIIIKNNSVNVCNNNT